MLEHLGTIIAFGIVAVVYFAMLLECFLMLMGLKGMYDAKSWKEGFDKYDPDRERRYPWAKRPDKGSQLLLFLFMLFFGWTFFIKPLLVLLQ